MLSRIKNRCKTFTKIKGELFGMKRPFIITAKSDKHGGYCVSGIELSNNLHYRLCSSNALTCGAVEGNCLKYRDGTLMNVLDIVEFEVICQVPEHLQPENLLINWEVKPIKIGEFEKDALDEYLTDYRNVFFDTFRKIDPENCPQNGDFEHSIELIKVADFSIDKIVPWYGNTPKIYGSFIYNGRRYAEISITDPVIKKLFLNRDLGCYQFGMRFLLLSLGARWEDGKKYKLIATVF
jgi:hypothetical protein